MKPTRARKACDRAAKACAKAYEALAAFNDFVPNEVSDRHLRWMRELNEYTGYLERATWPDKTN